MPIFGEYIEITVERRDEMVEYIVSQIERVGMFTPAAFILETGQPLSFLFSQIAYGAAPFGEAILKGGQHRIEDYAQVFEDRKNLNILIERIHKRAKEVEIEETKERIRQKRLKKEAKIEKKTTNGGLKWPWSKK